MSLPSDLGNFYHRLPQCWVNELLKEPVMVKKHLSTDVWIQDHELLHNKADLATLEAEYPIFQQKRLIMSNSDMKPSLKETNTPVEVS